MITRRSVKNGVSTRGKKHPADIFLITANPRDKIISAGSNTNSVDQDANITTSSSAVIDKEFDILVSLAPKTESISLSSSNTNIATVNSSGIVTRVANGSVRIIGTNSRGRKVQTGLLSITRQTTTTTTFNSFVSGSFAKNTTDEIDPYLRDDLETDGTMHNGSTYNPLRWCSHLNITGISREIPRCTAITPRHVVMAEHYQKTGSVSFLASDNTIVTRNIVRRKNVGLANNVDNYITDVTIGLLSSDLPSSIKYYKLLPSDVADYLPTTGDYYYPVMCYEQQERMLVREVFSLNNNGYIPLQISSALERSLYTKDLVPGDSGNPVFIIGAAKEPILLTTLTFGGAGAGPALHTFVSQINTAISQVDAAQGVNTGYTATIADLSSFINYG